MIIRSLSLVHWKNYSKLKLTFDEGINLISGSNGMGKTNILDAIYYLCLGKSYFSSQDRYVIQHDADFVRLEGHFEGDERLKVEVKLQPGHSKEILVNNDKLTRLMDHPGTLPCIVIAPIDIQLLLEGSEARRRFINNTVIQYDRRYTHALIAYNRLVKQRNALLKQMAESRTFNRALLEAHTVPMIEPTQYIMKVRQQVSALLSADFEKSYQVVSGGAEITSLVYKPSMDEADLLDQWMASMEKDKVLARTNLGVHKDDLTFIMNDNPIKYYGSQGQLKSYVLSLKLAQYTVLKSQINVQPILLLDDIFDKLDKDRVQHLLQIVTQPDFGQVFITDTSRTMVPELLNTLGHKYRTFVVQDAQII